MQFNKKSNQDLTIILPGNTITPNVQNNSIQHKIVSLYLLGWNSPKYGKQIPIAPVILQKKNKNTLSFAQKK